MAKPAWLLEVTGYTAAATSAVYRYSNKRYGYRTKSSDTPADTLYDNLLYDIGMFRSELFSAGNAGIRNNGSGSNGYGVLKLANISGALDSIFATGSISFRERSVLLKRISDDRAALSTATTMLSAVVGQIELSDEFVEIGLKSVGYVLNTPHLTATFAGTNALPAGVEGVSDLAGKLKPAVYGKVLMVSPPCNNTSKLIYYISSRAIQTITAYDGGVVLTKGADYTSQSDMETNAPAANTYRVWPAGGMIRLGSSIIYQLTVDVSCDSSANSTAAQIIKNLVLDRGFVSGDISASDITALDTQNSSVLGVYIDSSTSTSEIIAKVASTVGASYYFDRTNVLRLKRFDAPSGTPVDTIAQYNAGKLQRVASGEDVPTTTIKLNYAQYHQTLSKSEVAGSISEAAAADFAQEWRVAKYTGTLSPNPYRTTQEETRDTLFTLKADADTEAARLYGITSSPRFTYKVSDVSLENSLANTYNLGDCISVRWNRFGMSLESDTLFRIIGIEYDYTLGVCHLTIWG